MGQVRADFIVMPDQIIHLFQINIYFITNIYYDLSSSLFSPSPTIERGPTEQKIRTAHAP